MIEGSGSVLCNNISGSGRFKNIRNRRIRLRIRNTDHGRANFPPNVDGPVSLFQVKVYRERRNYLPTCPMKTTLTCSLSVVMASTVFGFCFIRACHHHNVICWHQEKNNIAKTVLWIPDPWTRTTGIGIRILLFSTVAFKMPTKFFPMTYCRYRYIQIEDV